jgi:hypothetical protein
MGGIVENPGQGVFEDRDRLDESHPVFAQIQPSLVFVPFEQPGASYTFPGYAMHKMLHMRGDLRAIGLAMELWKAQG